VLPVEFGKKGLSHLIPEKVEKGNPEGTPFEKKFENFFMITYATGKSGACK